MCRKMSWPRWDGRSRLGCVPVRRPGRGWCRRLLSLTSVARLTAVRVVLHAPNLPGKSGKRLRRRCPEEASGRSAHDVAGRMSHRARRARSDPQPHPGADLAGDERGASREAREELLAAGVRRRWPRLPRHRSRPGAGRKVVVGEVEVDVQLVAGGTRASVVSPRSPIMRELITVIIASTCRPSAIAREVAAQPVVAGGRRLSRLPWSRISRAPTAGRRTCISSVRSLGAARGGRGGLQVGRRQRRHVPILPSRQRSRRPFPALGMRCSAHSAPRLRRVNAVAELRLERAQLWLARP